MFMNWSDRITVEICTSPSTSTACHRASSPGSPAAAGALSPPRSCGRRRDHQRPALPSMVSIAECASSDVERTSDTSSWSGAVVDRHGLIPQLSVLRQDRPSGPTPEPGEVVFVSPCTVTSSARFDDHSSRSRFSSTRDPRHVPVDRRGLRSLALAEELDRDPVAPAPPDDPPFAVRRASAPAGRPACPGNPRPASPFWPIIASSAHAWLVGASSR